MRQGKLLLLTVVAFLAVTGYSASCFAGVNVNIGIGIPAPLVVAEPPVVVLIPGTYAYFAPDIDVDIFFFHGYWYRPYEGRWFRSRTYNGSWVRIDPRGVPRDILDRPPDFRRYPPGHERIPYGQLKKNWSRWERDKHWERKYEHEYKHERKEHRKEEKRERKEKGDKGRGKHRGED